MVNYPAIKLTEIYADMPINSKYTNDQVEQIITDLLAVLSRHDANLELSLMTLGNAVSHIIGHSVPKAQQAQIADSFNQALKASLQS